MRVPSPGRRRCSRPSPRRRVRRRVLVHVDPRVPPTAAARRAAAGLDDAGYLARRRPAAAPARRALGRARSALRPGPGRDRDRGQRRPAARPLAGRAARPSRAGARRRPRARARALPRRPEVWTERPPVGADPQVTGPGWRAGARTPDRHMVFDTEAVDGLVHAYLARDVLGLDARHRRAHPRPDPPRRHEPRLALAGAAAEPVQLVRRDVRRRRDRQRRPRATLADGHGAPPRALPRRRASRTARRPATSARACASTTCPHRGLRTRSTSTRPSTRTSCWASRASTARRARPGMRPPAQLGLLREWVRRAIAGYWTHGGYLNWDTGLGFHRWHQRKKVGAGRSRR